MPTIGTKPDARWQYRGEYAVDREHLVGMADMVEVVAFADLAERRIHHHAIDLRGACLDWRVEEVVDVVQPQRVSSRY